MDGFTVDGDEGTITKRGNGESWVCSHLRAQHRRSKSVSNRKLDASRRGGSHFMGKEPNVSHDLQHKTRTHRIQSPLHEDPTDTRTNISSNHQASLEKDIEQLQLQLQQEKSTRIMLERAMGRASSTLSPGHRHFSAQTKELIAEIELLEEEVANREQHVLSLYRSIFDHCISRASSGKSSGMSSPAHLKNEVRKHPGIISSAFCSSKKFPLQPFRVLASVTEPRKKTVSLPPKARHASLLNGKTDFHMEKNCSDPIKVHENVSTVGSTPLARTLKDHLYQCPSKLSEELVKCMAAIYCWMCSAASAKPEKKSSPLLSRSSTSVILPRHGNVEDQDWSCKSMVEVSWISTDKNQFSRASYAINNYRLLVEQLERVNAKQMGSNAQLAFWINVYNSLVMHAYLAYGIPHSSLRRMALFHKAAYNIGGHIISVDAIEQSIFSFRTPRIGRWFETILTTALRKKSGEEKQLLSSRFCLLSAQPLAVFALCTGASSDPMLKVYTATNVKEELEAAKEEFLQANVVVKKSRKVFLPKVLERFAKESSINSDDLLKWVSENVDKKLHDSIQNCIDCGSKGKVSHIIEWLPYNAKFRYIFAKDLTEKPWWV